jgi:transposase
MMGHQPQSSRKLFYTKFNLDKRIRKDHLLRKVDEHIHFDFIYQAVEDKYGNRGNVSIPPPVILKMMLLLILYNVRSERELMDTIPERLDWLWFLGYDLDDEIPNHSVLSKARTRWGVEAFRTFFERIVSQCVEAGLVDGRKLFMDASLIQANASNNSVVRRADLDKGYAVLESRLEREADSCDDNDPPKSGTANRKHISTTDPDASICRHSKGESKLQYKVHRGVDDRCEIITATQVTPAEVHDAHRLASLIDRHQSITNNTVTCCVADKKYGTIKNYLTCHDLGIKPHISPLEKSHRSRGRQKGIFAKEVFSYDPISDTFTCPEGQKLQKRNYYKKREKYEYKASSEVCASCQLRRKCTRARDGRTLKRHVRQEDLDKMLKIASSAEAEKDIKERQHLVERSFARGTRYGFKRARWRRLWRVRIQEYLTAAVQNLMVLLKYVKEAALA